MQEVNLSINALIKKFEDFAKSLPQQRAELHEKIGAEIKLVLDEKIADSLNDSNRHIRDMQGYIVGSGGGYVAVRAKKGGVRGKNAGAITNYLEKGHKMVLPQGKGKGTGANRRVAGRFFYLQTRIRAENISAKACDEFFAGIVEVLEK